MEIVVLGDTRDHIPLHLLLAQQYDNSFDPTEWWISEKVDGVRALWNGRRLYTRNGHAIPAPDWFTKSLPSDLMLDGEIFGGRGKFQFTNKAVTKNHNDDWQNLVYCVFDAPKINQPFEDRMEYLRRCFDQQSFPYARLVAQIRCQGRSHLDEELERVARLGGEGLMLRQPLSMYVCCRSKTLLKVKKFHDAEAIVVGYNYGKGKTKTEITSLRCMMECGLIINLGTGLSHEDRKHPPVKGSIVSYMFNDLSDRGMPRCAKFRGVRKDIDKPKDAVLPGKTSNRISQSGD